MTKEQIEAFKVDKTKWPSGPWDNEPDRMDFRHAGLPCLMLRNEHTGGWCGYAGVSEGHQAFGKPYDYADVKVHGGMTYAHHCAGNICHVPEPGEPDTVYWLDFDCGHSGDILPGMITLSYPGYGTYCDVDYVRREVERLAEQLAVMA